MGRIGRLVVLGVLSVGLLVASAMTVPGTLDNSDPRSDPGDDCSFTFTAYSLNDSSASLSATPYDELDPTVRAVFDRTLASADDTISINRSTWVELDATMNLTEYIRYEDTRYLSETRYEGCQRWEAEYTDAG